MTFLPKLAGVIGATLAFGAGAGHASERQGTEAREQEQAGREVASREITGRLVTSPGKLLLEVGGAVVELGISREGEVQGGEPRSRGPSEGHEVRASLTVDDRTTSVFVRISPPGSATTRPPR